MRLPTTRRLVSVATIMLLVGVTTVNARPPQDRGNQGSGFTATTANTTSANSVSGEAFGVSVNVLGNVAGNAGDVTVGTCHVVLPPDGGMVQDQFASIRVSNLVSSETLKVVTTGAIGPNRASAQSSATVEQVSILNGLVTAKLVVAMASSTADGATASSTSEGSTLIDLTVDGIAFTETPAPNTTISIPGVGTVILNEQLADGDGVHSTALTVNMIHVVLNVLNVPNETLKGDIIVASAHSDVNFTPAPKQGNPFMTGGGRLGTGRDIATFGFNAGERGGVLRGQLEYHDHFLNLNVHGTVNMSFGVISDTTCVTFSGAARVNNVDGYEFMVKQACDNGEPGVGRDTFDISVSGPDGFSYSRLGTLTGGNLQLHPD